MPFGGTTAQITYSNYSELRWQSNWGRCRYLITALDLDATETPQFQWPFLSIHTFFKNPQSKSVKRWGTAARWSGHDDLRTEKKKYEHIWHVKHTPEIRALLFQALYIISEGGLKNMNSELGMCASVCVYFGEMYLTSLALFPESEWDMELSRCRIKIGVTTTETPTPHTI